MKESMKKALDGFVKKYRTPIFILLVIICISTSAYTLQLKQSAELKAANKEISQLTFDRDLALKQNQSNSSVASSLFSMQMKYSKVHPVIIKDGFCYVSGLPWDTGPHKLQGTTNDKSLLVIQIECGIIPGKNIQSLLLEIADKPAFPVWEVNQILGINTVILYVEYLKEGVSPGKYNSKIIAVSDGKQYQSQPFTIEIPTQ